MSAIIKVENLGKKYTIRHEHPERYTALRDVMAQKAKKLFSFPQKLRPAPATDYEDFWALKDLNFEIEQGDRVGIIGRNGAGKSTLLKILSRITEPSTGKIELHGRVASLLEVGTGFHPELTGRENIYLNGAILGMSRLEIRKKFDEIVDFSGVEKFLDTPVKRYSSGMYVRLAFAVAAHLEPEILVVDEVLAVGDAEFQKKCLGKMEDVSKSGRTVIFVSHNMATIQNLCLNTIFLNQGSILTKGKTSEVIEKYLNINSDKTYEWQGEHKPNDFLKINKVSISKDLISEDFNNNFYVSDRLYIKIDITFFKPITGIALELFVQTIDGSNVFSSFTERRSFTKGESHIICTIPENIFNNIQYLFTLGISKDYTFFITKLEEVLIIDINNKIEKLGSWAGEYPGIVRPSLNWEINNKFMQND